MRRTEEIGTADGYERPIEDLIGEALLRHRRIGPCPLWRDLPEPSKELWRGTARNLLAMFDKVVATNDHAGR